MHLLQPLDQSSAVFQSREAFKNPDYSSRKSTPIQTAYFKSTSHSIQLSFSVHFNPALPLSFQFQFSFQFNHSSRCHSHLLPQEGKCRSLLKSPILYYMNVPLVYNVHCPLQQFCMHFLSCFFHSINYVCTRHEFLFFLLNSIVSFPP